MTDSNRTMTDATTKALEESLAIARDNGHATAEPIHLAAALFANEDGIGARVVAKTDASTRGGMSQNIVDVRQVRQALQRAILKKPTQSPPPHEANIGNALQRLSKGPCQRLKQMGIV